MPLNKPIVVDGVEWKEYYSDRLKEAIAYQWEEEPIEEATLAYMEDGDVDRYIDTKLKGDGRCFGALGLRKYRPLKDLDEFIHHTQRLWTRILENPKPFLSHMDLTDPTFHIQHKFDAWIKDIGTVRSPIWHPKLSAEVFTWIYGEAYDPDRKFPMALGKDNWVPEIDLDPDRKYLQVFGPINRYLFTAEDHFRQRQALGLVDYALSTIPHLNRLEVFDLTLHYDEYTRHFTGKKREISDMQLGRRNAFGKFFDYYGEDDPGYTFDHVDPELEAVIKEQLFGENGHPAIKKLADFLHRHPNDYLDAEEPDE